MAEPGGLGFAARSGLQAFAIHPAVSVADREQVRHVKAALVDDAPLDVGHDGDAGPGAVEVAGGGAPDVAEPLEGNRRAPQRNPEHVAGLRRAFRDAVARDQLGDRDAFAA